MLRSTATLYHGVEVRSNSASAMPAGLLDHAAGRFDSAVGRPPVANGAKIPSHHRRRVRPSHLTCYMHEQPGNPDAVGYLDLHLASCLRLRHWAFRPSAGRAHQWSCNPHQLRTATYRVRGHRGEGSPSTWRRQPTPVDAGSEGWSGAWGQPGRPGSARTRPGSPGYGRRRPTGNRWGWAPRQPNPPFCGTTDSVQKGTDQ